MSTTFTRGENPLRADKLNQAFSERVSRDGDTMLGMLSLVGDPLAPFDAATKQYVDRLAVPPQGATGPAGPPGPMGPPGSVSAGTVTGPLYWTATGGNTPRSAQDRAADRINVLDRGADPTGVLDSSAAFASALATRRNGRPVEVYAPTGVYRLNYSFTGGDVLYSQRLFGDGWSTVLLVGPRFDPSALGVIQAVNTSNNSAQFSICDLQIQFEQPPDFTTPTTASTSIGAFTITLSDVSGVRLGMYCVDSTNQNTLPNQSTMPMVTNIVGNVVTLSQAALATIPIGHVMSFAANRSQAVALSSFPTLTPGAPAIKYPWAIYSISKTFYMDHVLVSAAWNGVYIRGSTFVIGQYFNTSLNVGLDVDQCYNFPKIDHYQMHPAWGLDAAPAMLGIYYDGGTIAANVGQCDDFACDLLQSFCGQVNLTANFSWGKINQLSLDGNNANFSNASTKNGWLQIGQLYSTGGTGVVGTPYSFTALTCRTTINSFVTVRGQAATSIVLTGGALIITSGWLWNGQQSSNAMITQSGGELIIANMRFDSASGKLGTYLTQTGGVVRISDSDFVGTPGVGAKAFDLTDNEANSITNVELNGWLFTVPPTGLGRYENRRTGEVTFTNGSSVLLEVDTPTTAQLTLKPMSAFSAQGKLRFFGSYPTADTVPRFAASVRSGFTTESWSDPFFGIWMADGTVNSAGSDANMTRMVNVRPYEMTFGFDTNTISTSLFVINAAASVGKRLSFRSAGLARFEFGVGTAESGGNSGSNLGVYRFDDAGAVVDIPFSINRSSGLITTTALTTGVLNAISIGATTPTQGTFTQINMTTTSGPNIRGGVGAPASAQPKGSVFFRTDGAVGSTLYVSQGGGTWNPVAGV